ncbi:MAG: transporter [Bacteroidia bacterium]|nr:transporter [Bacteroidia bacterium]
MHRLRAFLLPVWAIFSTVAFAQQDMATDRPDQTETSSVVPTGWLQVEIGLSRSDLRFSSDGRTFLEETEFANPDALFRFGFATNYELRLELGYRYVDHWSDFNHLSRAEEYLLPRVINEHGFVPLSAGLKTALREEHGILPEAAFIFMLAIPGSGAAEFDIEHYIPEARFACSHTLSDHFSLGYNLGMAFEGSLRDYVGFYSVALGSSLTDVVGAYVELYGDLGAGTEPVHRFDGGFTWLVDPDVQLDLSAGYTLTVPHRPFPRDESEYYLAAGCSLRMRFWGDDETRSGGR